jgi:hypothetical protein
LAQLQPVAGTGYQESYSSGTGSVDYLEAFLTTEVEVSFDRYSASIEADSYEADARHDAYAAGAEADIYTAGAKHDRYSAIIN